MANEINATGKYLDLVGLQTFWQKAKEYIINHAVQVNTDHTQPTLPDTATVNWRPEDNKWVTVSSSVNGTGASVYTINDGAINAKMGLIENELASIKASAGLTGMTVTDTELFPGDPETGEGKQDNYVVVKVNDSVANLGTKQTGDVSISFDQSNLHNKFIEIDSKFGALARVTDFKGVFDSLEVALNSVSEIGDIVIVGSKEYIYAYEIDTENPKTVEKFVELGDTTDEVSRISALELWVNTPLTTAEIESIFEETPVTPEE